MSGDDDDESRQTISAAQLLSMGSCSAEEIGHIRLIVAWGNAFPAGINGLSAMLEKGVELAAALQRQDTVCALQTQCVELGRRSKSSQLPPLRSVAAPSTWEVLFGCGGLRPRSDRAAAAFLVYARSSAPPA